MQPAGLLAGQWLSRDYGLVSAFLAGAQVEVMVSRISGFNKQSPK